MYTIYSGHSCPAGQEDYSYGNGGYEDYSGRLRSETERLGMTGLLDSEMMGYFQTK